MNITGLALKRPVTVAMILTCVLAFGLIASQKLPLALFPNIKIAHVFIMIPYRNATPTEIEQNITRPIEEVLSTISHVKRLTSYTTENQVNFNLQLDWGADIRTKGIEAKEKIDSIRHLLPDDMENILLMQPSTNDIPIMELRVSSERDLSNAYELLDVHLKRKLERIDGVSRVELYGTDKKAIRIQLIKERLLSHRIPVDEVFKRLQQYNFIVQAGEITDQRLRYRVTPVGEYESLDDIKNLLIKDTIKLKDIAHIIYAPPKKQEGRHLDGSYAIGLMVQKEANANLVKVADEVLRTVREAEKNPLFNGINLITLGNAAEDVTGSLNNLLNSGLIGALLSICVLFFFLRKLSTTLIVTLSVPLAIMFTLSAMYFLNISLNVLSMMGLMIAVGMLVDNAVVITESIGLKQQQYPDNPYKAATEGVKEVGTAVMAGTITTIIVFLPNILGDLDQISVMLRQIAITICISLFASLLIAKALIPFLTSRIATKSAPVPGFIMRLSQYYQGLLSRLIARPRIGMELTALILITAALPINLVETDMFPNEESRRLELIYNPDGIYSVANAEKFVDQVEAYLFANKERLDIESLYSYYNNNFILTRLYLHQEPQTDLSVSEIKKIITDELPTIPGIKPGFESKRSGDNEAVSIRLIGESTEVLKSIAKQLMSLLENQQGFSNVRSQSTTTQLEARITTDQDTNLGISNSLIANNVATYIRGNKLRSFRDAQGETDIFLEIEGQDQLNIQDIRQLPIARLPLNQSLSSQSSSSQSSAAHETADSSAPVLLDQLAELKIEQSLSHIYRINRQTSIRIEMDLVDLNLDQAKEKINPIMEQLKFPYGYRWNFGESFIKSDDTRNYMGQNMLFATILIYLVMAALFESLLFPAAILSTILFAVIGVFWFFMLTGSTFSFMSLIGILLLMGVVVNNGIVMLDHIIHLRKGGLSRDEAILKGARDRLRPILMTVGTTVFGLIPLAIGDAHIAGSEGPAYHPMARAIIGGLLFSTVVTLFILPTLYLMLDEFREACALRRWSLKQKIEQKTL